MASKQRGPVQSVEFAVDALEKASDALQNADDETCNLNAELQAYGEAGVQLRDRDFAAVIAKRANAQSVRRARAALRAATAAIAAADAELARHMPTSKASAA